MLLFVRRSGKARQVKETPRVVPIVVESRNDPSLLFCRASYRENRSHPGSSSGACFSWKHSKPERSHQHLSTQICIRERGAASVDRERSRITCALKGRFGFREDDPRIFEFAAQMRSGTAISPFSLLRMEGHREKGRLGWTSADQNLYVKPPMAEKPSPLARPMVWPRLRLIAEFAEMFAETPPAMRP